MRNLNPLLLIALLIAHFGMSVSGQDLQNPGLVGSPVSSDGAMTRVNLQRNGVYRTKGLHQVSAVLWKSEVLCKRAQSNVYYHPIIAGSFVYFRCGSSTSRDDGTGDSFYFSDDFVYALDTKTGKQIWKFQMKRSHLSTLAVAGDLVFFGSDSGYFGSAGGVFFALDATTGQEKWNYKLKNSRLANAAPAVANGLVFFRDAVGNLHALDAQIGKPFWTFSTKGDLTMAAILEETIYFGSSKGFIYAVDTRTGNQQWEFKVGSPPSHPVISDGLVYFSVDENIYALDAKTGKQILKVKLPRKMGSLFAIFEKVIYYGGSSDNYYAIDIQTGEEKWRFKTGRHCQFPVIADGAIYFSCYDGNLYALNVKTGQQEWKVESKPHYSNTPAVDSGTIYFASTDGRVYSVR